MNSLDLKKYKLLEKIGFGNFGDVFKIQNKRTKEIYAAKISSKSFDDLPDTIINNFKREVSIISKVHHPSVIRFIGSSLNDFKNENKLTIVTDYLPNKSLEEIFDLVQKSCSPDQWNDTTKLINIYGIAAAMSYLHAHDILHRDLKPANILLDQNFYPVIADFGLSKDETSSTISIDIKGTPLYIAPEIWEETQYKKEADVYSFAYIIYEMFVNEKPYQDITIYKLSQKICRGERPDITMIPEPYKNLIESCWDQDPSNRPSFDQIVSELEGNSEFITDLVDEDQFLAYIKYIKESPQSYDDSPQTALTSDSEEEAIDFPSDEYDQLPPKLKKKVDEAANDPDKQFEVGSNLTKGTKGYPKDVPLGVKYLKKSIKGGNLKAVLLYNRMLIIGSKIESNIDEAKENLSKFDDLKDPNVIFLQAMIARKEEDYEEAVKLLRRSIRGENGEAMFEYGKMLYLGQGVEKNEKKALNYFEQAKENGCNKSDRFLEEQESDDTSTFSTKTVDIVFMIDGTNPNRFFYESVKQTFSQFAKSCPEKYPEMKFRFGAVIYLNTIVLKRTKNKSRKMPFVFKLTDKIDKVQSFLDEHYTFGGGIKLANDWAVGYNCLLDEMNWDKSSEKVVIQLCQTPGHGRGLTMKRELHKKYLKIPNFNDSNSFNENLEIYNQIQIKQRNWVLATFAKIAKKGIKIFCLNGNEVSMYFLKRINTWYFKRGGKNFVIKNLFGFTSIKKEDSVNMKILNKQVNDFFSIVVQLICNNNSDEIEEFEKNCKQKFQSDLDTFCDENDQSSKSTETEDDDDDFDVNYESENEDNDENDDDYDVNYDSENEDDDDNDRPNKFSKMKNVRSSPKIKRPFNPFDFDDKRETKPKNAKLTGFKSTSNINKVDDDDNNERDKKKRNRNSNRRFRGKKQ